MGGGSRATERERPRGGEGGRERERCGAALEREEECVDCAAGEAVLAPLLCVIMFIRRALSHDDRLAPESRQRRRCDSA